MTIPNENMNGMGEIAGRKKKPEISLEWKDLTIEIKYCGQDIPSEAQEFVQYFPKVSENLLSAECIKEKRFEENKLKDELISSRPDSRIGHTLTHLLEHNQGVNNRLRDESHERNSTSSSPAPSSEVSTGHHQMDDEDMAASHKSDGSDLPDDIDQLIDTKKLISLPNGGKKCHICSKVFSDTTRIKRHLLSHSDKKPYKCHLCGWGFHQKCNMERHLTSHTKEGEGHPCPRCNSWFTTKSVLSLHLKDAHNEKYMGKKEVAAMSRKTDVKQEEPSDTISDEGNYETLEIPFPTEPSKEKNWTSSDEKNGHDEQIDLSNLTCHLCGKSFVKKTNLKHHLMLHRGEKPWKCHICSWRFVQKCNLKKHIETHTNGTYKCPQCDIMFASKGAVSGHVSIVHFKPGMVAEPIENEEEEETEIPAPSLSTKSPVKKTMTKKASSPAMMWWKHLDAPPIPTDDDQTEEKSEHENVTKYQSPSISITPKTTLNIPKVTPTKVVDSTQIQCKSCPKTFPSKAELEKHMLVHKAEMKPYACPVCGWRFHLLHNMKRHLKTHEDSGDIEAGTADELLEAVEATASKTSALTSPGAQQNVIPANVDGMISPQSTTSSVDHQETAGMSVKSLGHLKCNFCSKWFNETVALNRHMEVHSSERPFACPICGWRFKQMHNMKRHMLTHSGAKPYSCDFCDKSYTDNYSLKQHVAKIHPDVASQLPHMLITPRLAKKTESVESTVDGFKSMVNEMTESQKAAVLQIYQQQLVAQSEALSLDLPSGIEPVTYTEDEIDNENIEDNQDCDISEFMDNEPDDEIEGKLVISDESNDSFTIVGAPEIDEPMEEA